jgi:DNA-binding transcriptional LysR family regulator
MNNIHIRSIDLNLLVVAEALYRHRNVSRAAEDLGLSQSAVSHALTRLRDQFKDPFFVRTAKGMAPTEYARKIQPDLMDIVHRMELLASRQTEFKPFEADGRIAIASTDYFEILVMPRLQEVLAREAPQLQISLRPTRGDLPKRDLEEGVIDIAVAGFYRDLPEGFYQSKLYTDRFQCAVGSGHPLFKSKDLAREEYLAARHALITLQGDFREKVPAGKNQRERRIVYGSYSFTGMAWVLQGSELLLTAPSLLLREYEKHFPLQVWPSPVERGQIDIRMVWHAQTHEDPLRSWVRTKLKQICTGI